MVTSLFLFLVHVVVMLSTTEYATTYHYEVSMPRDFAHYHGFFTWQRSNFTAAMCIYLLPAL